jgi:nucleoside-diphosphate-sugar epimerase
VTGGTGFVGRAVIRELAHRGHKIRALTRQDQSITPEGVTWVSGNLDDTSALDQLVSGAEIIVHIAGLIKARNTREFFSGNEAGTQNLLKSVERTAALKPVRFVHVSTIAAREPQLSPYAASKAAGEAVLRAASENVSWTILRPPAVYGPEDKETRIVPR